MSASARLTLDHVHVTATLPDGSPVTLVHDMGFTLRPGERLALVGESGSGKSVTARAILRLNKGLHTRGSIRLDDLELTGLSEREIGRVRGRRIGMVFQDPLSALNPLMTIGDHVMEPLISRGVRRREAHARARAVLHELGVADVERRMRAYPHEFSGGMRQRVVIAMALVGEPDYLIADEPTTALDVHTQAQVLDLLSTVAAARGLGVLIITHDVGVVANFADRVVVMYRGRKLEEADAPAFFASPAHPYSRALLAAVPRHDGPLERLATIDDALPPGWDREPAGTAVA